MKDVKPESDNWIPIFKDHSGHYIENKLEGSKSKADQSEGCVVSRQHEWEQWIQKEIYFGGISDGVKVGRGGREKERVMNNNEIENI